MLRGSVALIFSYRSSIFLRGKNIKIKNDEFILISSCSPGTKFCSHHEIPYRYSVTAVPICVKCRRCLAIRVSSEREVSAKLCPEGEKCREDFIEPLSLNFSLVCKARNLCGQLFLCLT